jgi:tyrosine-protein kinase Etk/Wzc
MSQPQNFKTPEENDLQKIIELLIKNFRLFIFFVFISLFLAFLINHYIIPVYGISSSILIKENKTQQNIKDANNFINSSLFGENQNFQNELWVIKSSPVLKQTIQNLDLSVTYYKKEGFQFHDVYQSAPFKIFFLSGHPQPINVRFELTFLMGGYFQLKAVSGKASFYNFETNQITNQKDNWVFNKTGKLGELIETDDLAFIISPDSSKKVSNKNAPKYGFEFNSLASLTNEVKKNLNFIVIDKMATVIEISLKSESIEKGIDIVNELMNVYSEQNLRRDRKSVV